MMALLLCTGFIVTQPISVMAEEIMIFAQTAQQQKQSVSGVIKDATGEPVIGASVLEKGTTNGTITDFDGRFTLNVIPGTTLIISYIGYAVGMGIERITNLKYQVKDLRMFSENDTRFLKEFEAAY